MPDVGDRSRVRDTRSKVGSTCTDSFLKPSLSEDCRLRRSKLVGGSGGILPFTGITAAAVRRSSRISFEINRTRRPAGIAAYFMQNTEVGVDLEHLPHLYTAIPAGVHLKFWPFRWC